jgi:hypothetical protein
MVWKTSAANFWLNNTEHRVFSIVSLYVHLLMLDLVLSNFIMKKLNLLYFVF